MKKVAAKEKNRTEAKGVTKQALRMNQQVQPRTKTQPRRFPIGAEVRSDGVHFRVWAPKRQQVDVIFEGGAREALALVPEGNGYFSGFAEGLQSGTRYRYRLDGEGPYPDPASRFQPEGPHGPSQVIDPSTFHWTDGDWQGVTLEGQVIYEMHIGTFTQKGTWEAAARELPELARLGITLLEVMPVADFPGTFGRTGVSMFAPTRLYGTPDDFRHFVNEAHAVGIGVILDVVYNHLGPDGNYLKAFSDDYFTDRYKNEWGEPINFDGPNSGSVREFFSTNAAYWVKEFHIDGLRLDATQQIFDASEEHILTVITQRVRESAGEHSTVIVAENEPQNIRVVRPIEQGGHGMDAVWNDDFHHSAIVALTGRNAAYYSDHLGSPQELISAMKWGYLFQGQRYKWQGKRRGTPALNIKAPAFVAFLQNHDQIANSGDGDRIDKLTTPGRFRAITALMLLGPGTPMLFQGQEYAASQPFLYFADHKPELSKLVHKGRKEFLAQFPALATAEMQARIADPSDPQTFTRCKLDFGERERHASIYALHKDLLGLRRSDPIFRRQRSDLMHGAVLGPEAFLLRFLSEDGNDRLLLVNLGRDLHLDPAPEPLLAPPEDTDWAVLWSSEDPRYGGLGTPDLEGHDNWRIPGHAAFVLHPKPVEQEARED